MLPCPACRVQFLCVQDYVATPNIIYDNWQLHKMMSSDAKAQLVVCRCQNAQRLSVAIDWLDDAARQERMAAIIHGRREEMSENLGRFLGHPLIDEFMIQFQDSPVVEKCWRFRPLLLRGPTRSGKSRKGASLWGENRTLVVNCQGMSPALPSIKLFDSSTHEAILWDEISEQQVLHNKLVFQSGTDDVVLGQSACNAWAYSKNLFRVPMILCSNTFSFTASGSKPLPAEDVDWLTHNVIDAKLENDQPWFVPDMAFSDGFVTGSDDNSD